VQGDKVPESHEEFARVSPIVSLQGGAKIVNNHPADPIGTAPLGHEKLGQGGGPDIVHMLVFRDRSDLFLLQTAKSDAVLAGDVHVGLQEYQVAPAVLHSTPLAYVASKTRAATTTKVRSTAPEQPSLETDPSDWGCAPSR
jgi:hypothetical protein